MSGKVIGHVIIGIIMMMSLVELFHYHKLRVDEEDFPYPRRRLCRRLLISVLIIGIVILGLNWPGTGGPTLQILLLAMLLLAFLVMLALIFRDFRETGQSIAGEIDRFHRETSAPLASLITNSEVDTRDTLPGGGTHPPE